MKIESFQIKNFRNLKEVALRSCNNLEYLVGENAQGKTNILEAIGFSLTGRSFRRHDEKDFFNENNDPIFIQARVKIRDRSLPIELKIRILKEAKESFLFEVEGKKFHSKSAYLKELNQLGVSLVHHDPSSTSMILSDRSFRRQWLIETVTAYEPSVKSLWKRLEKLRIQKNHALEKKNDLFIKIMEEDFIQTTWLLYENLEYWIDRIQERLPFWISKIAPNMKNGFLKLERKYTQGLDFKAALKKSLRDYEGKEKALGRSIVGFHTEGLDWYLGDQKASQTCSQGEMRTLILGYKFVEMDLLKEFKKKKSVLFLDDFSTELDDKRRKRYIDEVLNLDQQVWITSTDFNSALPCSPRIIENGSMVNDGAFS